MIITIKLSSMFPSVRDDPGLDSQAYRLNLCTAVIDKLETKADIDMRSLTRILIDQKLVSLMRQKIDTVGHEPRREHHKTLNVRTDVEERDLLGADIHHDQSVINQICGNPCH